MNGSIMVPVDLAHKDALVSAINEAGALAKAKGAKLIAVGVTGSAPTEAAHTPSEFEDKLRQYAQEIEEMTGVPTQSMAIRDNDVAANLGEVLIRAADDMRAEMVVMQSHIPGFIEHVFSSNAGYLASHSDMSVLVVR